MAKSKLYEFAILYHPKPRKKSGEEVQGKSVLLTEPTRVLAASDAEVSILAAREIPAEYLDKLEDVEILVRPF